MIGWGGVPHRRWTAWSWNIGGAMRIFLKKGVLFLLFLSPAVGELWGSSPGVEHSSDSRETKLTGRDEKLCSAPEEGFLLSHSTTLNLYLNLHLPTLILLMYSCQPWAFGRAYLEWPSPLSFPGSLRYKNLVSGLYLADHSSGKIEYYLERLFLLSFPGRLQ